MLSKKELVGELMDALYNIESTVTDKKLSDLITILHELINNPFTSVSKSNDYTNETRYTVTNVLLDDFTISVSTENKDNKKLFYIGFLYGKRKNLISWSYMSDLEMDETDKKSIEKLIKVAKNYQEKLRIGIKAISLYECKKNFNTTIESEYKQYKLWYLD